MNLRSNISLISRYLKIFVIGYLIAGRLQSQSLASWQPWQEGGPPPRNEDIITSVPQICGIASIRFYQVFVSPVLSPDKCNFSPSCSNYSMMSIKRYGAAKGFVMTFDRLARDNPWVSRGGYEALGDRYFDPPSNNYYWW